MSAKEVLGMKYCPYCGAEIISAAAFCAECGKALPQPAAETGKDVSRYTENPDERLTKRNKKQSNGSKKVPRHRKPKNSLKKQEALPDELSCDAESGYDGYYDDILPADCDEIRQSFDKRLIKRLVLLILGVLAAVGVCVALMYMI